VRQAASVGSHAACAGSGGCTAGSTISPAAPGYGAEDCSAGLGQRALQLATRTDRGPMTRREIVLRGFVLLCLAAACGGDGGGGTGPNKSPVVVVTGQTASVPVGIPYAVSVTFQDSIQGGAPWTYTIEWGDGERSSGTQNSLAAITGSHTYASEASYEIKATVTDMRGAGGSDSIAITATAPVILAAGDIGDCKRIGDEQTAALLDTLIGIVTPLGDNAYENGTPTEYANCYDPTWGRQKARTRPVVGNHDYYNPGPGGTTNADGYYGYFGSAAGDPGKGYYSYTLGSWFVIVLNTGTDKPDSVKAGSTQEKWLRNELATHTQQCVLAMFHHPRFSTIVERSPIQDWLKALWDALYEYGADLVLNGHDHAYQRFAPQKPDGTADAAYGTRQIAVGTGGGETLYTFADPVPAGSNIQVRDNKTLGVLRVTLKNGGYDWRFIPAAGGTFTDSGSSTCHGRPQ
jgi:hypothetical protein